MNILLINQPLNNRGDESAHKALVRRLVQSFPEVKISVLFVDGNSDSIRQFSVIHKNVQYINVRPSKGYKWIGLPALHNNLYWLWQIQPTTRKLLKLYKKSDWVINAPGGICMGGFQNWNHLFFLKIAQYLKKPILYYGRSFGPFPVKTKSNRKFKEISISLLNYFSFLSIRDAESEKLAKQLKLEYIKTVDTAFLDNPHVSIPREIKDIIGNTPFVVFVPNLLIWHYAFKTTVKRERVLKFFEGVYREIIKKYPNHKIVMLPQTFNGGNDISDDIYFFRELKKHLNADNIFVLDDHYSSDVQQSIIGKADLMVGARYHSIVFAINNATPFVALSYEHKIRGLLETLGMTANMIEITPDFLNSDEEIMESYKEISDILYAIKSIDDVSQKAKTIAERSFSELIKILH